MNSSSTSHHIEETTPQGEHGTYKSYIIGFILSLVFTLIPYYLVVNKVVSGTVLLAAIIGIAVLQMIIQVLFFLHLGRGPKPRWNVYFFAATVGTIVFIVVASLQIMHHLHYNMTPVTPEDVSKKLVEKEGIHQIGGEETGACQGVHAKHKVTIRNGIVHPLHTTASICDTLTFINEDSKVRDMTFGTHPDHGEYGGESELSVRKGRAKTIILTEPGAFQFHDHLQAETAGGFTVLP